MRTVVVPGRGGGVPPTATPALSARAKESVDRVVAVVPGPEIGTARTGLDVSAGTDGWLVGGSAAYSIDCIEPGEMTALYGAGRGVTQGESSRGAFIVGRLFDRGFVRVSSFARGVASVMMRFVPVDAGLPCAALPMNFVPEYIPVTSHAILQAETTRAHANHRSSRTRTDSRPSCRQRQTQSWIKRSAASAA